MNIHVVTHNDVDGFLWGLLEGWLNCGICEQHNIRVSGANTLLPESEDFWATLPTSDAIVLCCSSGPSPNMRPAVDIIEANGLWDRTLFSDSTHGTDLKYPEVALRCRQVLVQKHSVWEKYSQHKNCIYYPRTGILDRVRRYQPALPWKQWKDLSAACIYRTYDRGQEHRARWVNAMIDLNDEGLQPEALTKTIWDNAPAPVDLRRVCRAKHCPRYLEFVSRCRVGVYLMGGNALGHQFWEYVTLKCAIVAMHPSIHPTPETDYQEWERFTMPLKEGEDFLYFHDEGSLKHHVKALLDEPERAEAMAKSAWQKCSWMNSRFRSRMVLSWLAHWAQNPVRKAVTA